MGERGSGTLASAGNFGPDELRACNLTPWILTVATIDRVFPTDVTLGAKGEGGTIIGNSLCNGQSLVEPTPLVYGGDVGSST